MMKYKKYERHQNIPGTNLFFKIMLATVLIIDKSFMRTFLVQRNKFTKPMITNKIRNRLTSGITNDRVTCITATDRFSNIKCFDELANTVDVTSITDIIGEDRFTNS